MTIVFYNAFDINICKNFEFFYNTECEFDDMFCQRAFVLVHLSFDNIVIVRKAVTRHTKTATETETDRPNASASASASSSALETTEDWVRVRVRVRVRVSACYMIQ